MSRSTYPRRATSARSVLVLATLLVVATTLTVGAVTAAPPTTADVPVRPATVFPTALNRGLAMPLPLPGGVLPALALSFDHYYTYEQLGEAMRELADRYPDLCELGSMGQSRDGRELWVMTLTNPDTGPAAAKPAIYIDGNTHGNEIQGSEISLYSIAALCDGFERGDPFLTWLLDTRAFYVAPCVNPDGRAYFLDDPNSPHSSRQNHRPTDNDGDGRFDEDPPNDLDGDGNLVRMRRKNPDGTGDWRISPDDPRLMDRMPADRRPLDLPRFFGPPTDRDVVTYDVWWSEGIDDDGDGRVNEDGIGGVDLNRNFPALWQPDFVQHGAGPYPLSEPEARGTADFIAARPNIAAIQSYHNSGGMILRGPGVRDAQSLVPRDDQRVFDQLGRSGEGIIESGYRYLVVYADLYTVHGGFLDWGYIDLGIITFSNEIWSMPFDYDGDGRVSGAESLRWNDEVLHGEGFIDWHEVEHPTLGTIEVGGWKKLMTRIPPAWQLPGICHRNFFFTMHHAAAMPEVAIDTVTVSKLDGVQRGWRVRTRVRNQALIPTITARGMTTRATRPDLATLTGDGITVIATGTPVGDDNAAEHLRLRVDASESAPARPPAVHQIGRIGSHGEVEIEWLLLGVEGTELTLAVDSVKGGTATHTFPLTPTE